MKRRGIGIGAAVVAAIGIAAFALFASGRIASTDEGRWAERADAAQAELEASFRDDARGLYNNADPCLLDLCTSPFHYWWQAHALDTLVDGYERTGDAVYLDRIEKMYDGILARNAGVFPNAYYDDMEWMALAWLRAFEATEDERYKAAAQALWEDIRTGWNDAMGGGIAWRKEQLDYKNTPANAPAVILAARLYQAFGDPADLEWAIRIYDWQKRTLVDPSTGLVWDGMNRQGDGRIDKDWIFTYGQGVYIGAGLELYRATGDPAYREDAFRTADYVRERLANAETGLLPSEGGDDGGLFKGILVRYLAELILEHPEEHARLTKLLVANGETLWEYGKSGDRPLFGPSWAQTPDGVVQLSTQLSGVMLLEQLARLEQMKVSGMEAIES
ncbi:glycoside hydrolase family 88 protein [Paenibacillus sp. TRM 82003]|nr:glycoside hydrolase family 88 protein [Paenibacillus sp. TRM 82003]